MKGKRTDFENADCAIARALRVIGDWWSLLIIRDAFRGCQRFGEFEKSLGIAKNILSSRLKKLTEEGILVVEAVGASRLDRRYVLTAAGRNLMPVLVTLWQWGEENCFKTGERKLAMIAKSDGKALPRMQVTAGDGQVLGAGDIGFRKISDFGSSASAKNPQAVAH